VRIFGPGASVGQDLEPEYISVTPDGTTAFVALQENNALAKIDLGTNDIEILPLGYKDHNLPGNGLDADKEDKTAVITPLPVFGMYQPDSIDTYSVGGMNYVVTANEGDGRDYDEYSDEADLGDLTLDPLAFSPAELAALNAVPDLTVTNALGDIDNDGEYEEVYVYGARSFTIFDENGTLVFDSGDQIEQIVAAQDPDFFNANNDNNKIDNRSDNKGPEPEALIVEEIDGQVIAFVGLERQGGVMLFDITDPTDVKFLEYFNNRDFDEDVETAAAGDLGPEGFAFVSAADSPIGEALLLVANEVSGTTTAYTVNIPEPASMALVTAGALLIARRRRG